MATDFKKKLMDEMEIRGLKEQTKRGYLSTMRSLCNYHKKRPDQLDLPEIKEYQRHLAADKKLAPNSINRAISAIRFFYKNILGRHWYDDALPRMRAPRKMPQVLSEEEVAQMIKAVDNLLYKAILMVTYSAGLRQGEVRNLKISDIDSKRMVIYIRDGKGGKDRQAQLTPLALAYLRRYWRGYRLKFPVKSDYLFVSIKSSRTYGKPLSHSAMGYMVSKAAELAGIKKKFTPIFCGTPLPLIF